MFTQHEQHEAPKHAASQFPAIVTGNDIIEPIVLCLHGLFYLTEDSICQLVSKI